MSGGAEGLPPGQERTDDMSRLQVKTPSQADAAVEQLIRARADAKKAKNFAEADRIRDELKARGIEVTDVPNGAKWKRI